MKRRTSRTSRTQCTSCWYDCVLYSEGEVEGHCKHPDANFDGDPADEVEGGPNGPSPKDCPLRFGALRVSLTREGRAEPPPPPPPRAPTEMELLLRDAHQEAIRNILYGPCLGDLMARPPKDSMDPFRIILQTSGAKREDPND